MAGRARGRGRGAPKPAAPAEQPAPAAPTESVSAPRPAAGRARGRGAPAAPAPAPQVSAPAAAPPAGISRPRGGGEVRSNGVNGLERRVAAMRVDGAGDREERPRFINDENVSSGNFDDFKINVDSIKGDRIQLITNAVALYPKEMLNEPAGFLYHVDFTPPVDNRRARTAMVRSKKELLGGPEILFDGGSALFTSKKIGAGEMIEFDVIREYDKSTIRVSLSLKNPIFVGHGEFNRISGILMKRALDKVGLTQLGRHHFYPEKKRPLKDGYELWPGFITGVNNYDAGLLLVMDTTFKLAHQRTVLMEMNDIYQRMRPRNPEENDRFQREITTQFVGKIIVTKYNMKRYRIDDITFDENPLSTFERKTGPVTYKAYYKEHYDENVTDDRQPLLISLPKPRDQRRGMDQPILLIPELCYITGISDELRNDNRFMLEMGKITRTGPLEKANTMIELVNGFKSKQEVKDSFDFWNMRLDRGLVQMTGIKLHPAEVHFQQRADYNTATADFQGCLRNAKFRVPINVQKYCILFTGQNSQNAQKLVEGLGRAGRGFGMNFGECKPIALQSNRIEDLIAQLRNVHSETQGLQLAIVVLPDNRADRYNAIKRQCYVETPVPSQCVLNRTLNNEKGFMSVVSKLALQINVKMGGEPWMCKLPVDPGAMIIGMDVHHVGKGGKGPSQLGFVSSLNVELTRFYSRVYNNESNEISGTIKVAFVAALQRFHSIHKKYPRDIFIFRDGVGEGQLGVVQREEVAVIDQALRDLECTSRICFVVVSKRIMQRFFGMQRGGQDLANPPPGTVAFDTVTKKDRYDFFLVPQSSRQGTVTPTHYNILFDNTLLEHGRLMALAFNLCHMYYNWTGAIRVPNVCQYAHKLAFLAGTSLGGGQPNDQLANTLYFL
uniref:Piwi-like protein 1 n=1 Tax=Isodiametra pulchra TaxID=504439 RepID=B9ZU53_ISOPU|nr:piwi-like protein 1 [Isodiametra pulchra]